MAHEASASALPAVPSRARRVWAVAVASAAAGLVIAMMVAVMIALPQLARDISASQAQQTWIVDAYTLVLAALVLPAGALGDRYGRRGMLLVGLVIFAASSAAPVLVDSAGWLIASRAVTGLGAALVLPATLSIITACFPGDARAHAVGIWAAVASLGGLLGLLLAGLMLRHFSWHATFVAPALLAALLFVAAWPLPPSRDQQSRPLDLPGAVSGVLAVGALVLGVLQSADRGWDSAVVIGTLLAGVVLAGGFVRIELRRRSPLLDVRLFTNRAFATGSLSVTLQFVAVNGAFYGMTQYLQLIQGHSALASALLLWPIALTLLPAALASAWLTQRFGLRRVTCVGLLVVAGGMLLLGRLDPASGYASLAVAVAVLGVGLGVTAPAATHAIVDNVSADKYGVASAVNDATREFGGALGIALAGSLLSIGYTHQITAATTALPPPAQEAAGSSLAAALATADRLGGPAGQHLAHVARVAFTHGMWLSSATLAGLVAAGALVLACLPRNRRRGRHA